MCCFRMQTWYGFVIRFRIFNKWLKIMRKKRNAQVIVSTNASQKLLSKLPKPYPNPHYQHQHILLTPPIKCIAINLTHPTNTPQGPISKLSLLTMVRDLSDTLLSTPTVDSTICWPMNAVCISPGVSWYPSTSSRQERHRTLYSMLFTSTLLSLTHFARLIPTLTYFPAPPNSFPLPFLVLPLLHRCLEVIRTYSPLNSSKLPLSLPPSPNYCHWSNSPQVHTLPIN